MLEPLERLRNAIIQANLPITKRLLARFPELWLNVDPSHDGWSNLHYASYHGNYLICFHLISFMNQKLGGLTNNYSYLDLISFSELSVIHLSAMKHHSQTLHYLLQEFPGKIWLNFAGGELKQTPLHYSCVNGFKEGVKLLLEFGADWRAQDLNGDTCLHLCFQYGHFACIEELLRFLASKCKESLKASIREYEETKNSKGWFAVDYAFDFVLIKNFKALKLELFDLQFQDSMPIYDTSSDSSSSFENKILQSPIVPMSQKDEPITPTGTTNPEFPKGRRPHSQSLPSGAVPEGLAKIKTSTSSRKRSNTTYNLRPPNIPTSLGGSPRATPQTPRTPSIKSVTISPSIRKSDEDGKISETDTVPESPLSIQTSFNSALFMVDDSRKNLSSQMSDLTLEDQWPLINTSPNHIAAQTALAPLRESRSSSSSWEIPVNSIGEVAINGFSRSSGERSRSVSVSRENSSPIHQISPSHTQHSPSHVQQNKPRRSSSSRQINGRTSLDSPSRRRPSLSQRSSGGTSSEDLPSLIRKIRSSGTLPISLNGKSILAPPLTSVGGLGNFSNDSSESLKRSNINSISFSRVR